MNTKFFFACACGCGQVSDNLGKEYMRLTRGNRWYAKDCVPKDAQERREFKGGTIVREEDF